CLLFLYKTGVIKVTEQFRTIIFTATAGIGLVYLVSFGLSFFGIRIPLIHESGWVGIGFSVFVTAVAALNLVLDFDFIENASLSSRFPKYMEWYAAFGLMVTLVWLYVEFLRLLSKLRRR
ncbi:MAG: Bax inhibitor-1/YccA family protein, partial [Candidatus Caenarcaniphilales bacterium]|nr:Bax inhibitor-1/YccA family protein [Candidatus Caenarcaniphilales bacterium]